MDTSSISTDYSVIEEDAAQSLGNDKRSNDELENLYEFRRKEDTKNFSHELFKMGVKYILVGIAIIFVVRLWHLICSHRYHWLGTYQIADIDQIIKYILFGSGGTFLFEFSKNKLKDK